MELYSLVVPQANTAEEAGKLLKDIHKLWWGTNFEERRRLLLSMLDAVYIDAKVDKCIVRIRPKTPLLPIFKVATNREGSM